MQIKRGTIISLNKNDNPTLETPEGQRYQVSFIAAYVWDLLNGSRSVSEIAKTIEKTGKLQDDNLPLIVTEVVKELETVNLARPLQR